MSQISPKLRSLEGGFLTYWCEGCNDAHTVMVGDGSPPRWGYNGNPMAPTFTPSVLVHGRKLVRDPETGEWTGGWERDAAGNTIPVTCHTFITDGRVQYLGDCTHHLAGQTVDLPDLPPYLRDAPTA